VDGLESFAGDVGIHFGGRDAGVAEQFLNDPQVGAVFEQVRCETVPQHVRRDVSLDAGEAAPFLDARPQRHRRKRRASAREENIPRTLAGLGQFAASVFQVALDCLDGAAAHRYDSLFISLADDVDKTGVELQLLEPQPSQLGQPQAGGVTKLKHRVIAKRRWCHRLNRPQQFLDLPIGQRLGQAFPAAGQRKVFGDIRRQKLFLHAEAVERLQRGDFKI